MAQDPSVGRIVHYHGLPAPAEVLGDGPRAAIITDVYTGPDNELNGYASLTVFHRGQTYSVHARPYAEEPTPGYWSWPPRV